MPSDRSSSVEVRVNDAMLTLLGGDPEFYEMSALDIPDKLLRLFADGFVETQNCILPQRMISSSEWLRLRPLLVDGGETETGAESFLSHIHIDSFLSEEATLEELARLGCDYAWLLRQQVLSSCVPGTFRIIVSAELPDGEVPNSPQCTVRLHKIRNDQPWLSKDLEDYKLEGLMVMDFGIPEQRLPQ